MEFVIVAAVLIVVFGLVCLVGSIVGRGGGW